MAEKSWVMYRNAVRYVLSDKRQKRVCRTSHVQLYRIRWPILKGKIILGEIGTTFKSSFTQYSLVTVVCEDSNLSTLSLMNLNLVSPFFSSKHTQIQVATQTDLDDSSSKSEVTKPHHMPPKSTKLSQTMCNTAVNTSVSMATSSGVTASIATTTTSVSTSTTAVSTSDTATTTHNSASTNSSAKTTVRFFFT